MMTNLSTSQRWAVVAIAAAICFMAVTLFLEGSIQIFGYVVVSALVAIYAVVTSNRR